MKPISKINVSTNQLFFRGLDVTELSANYDYEAVLYLLLNGRTPTDAEHTDLCQKLIELRKYYDSGLSSLIHLAHCLDHIREDNHLSTLDTLLTFVSLAPIVVANEFGRSINKKIEEQNYKLGHAANFLWMTRCRLPSEIDIRDFQTSLILHMDDPSNPSLSALIEELSHGKSISDALIAALLSHSDSLHHGAGAEAFKMLLEIKNQPDPKMYLRKRIDSGEKIFGLGHRIYKGKDPRAIVLEGILRRRAANNQNNWLMEAIAAVTKYGSSIIMEKKGVEVYPNVDLFNAAVYSTFGYSPELNTDLFAISRIAGWIAHTYEILALQT